MDNLTVSESNNSFVEIYRECLTNSSAFCIRHRNLSIDQVSVCTTMENYDLIEFSEQLICETLLTLMFLSHICLVEYNATSSSVSRDCIYSLSLPLEVCTHGGNGFLTMEHLSCFDYFTSYNDLANYRTMTTAEHFWFTMDNTCKQPNASRFGVCRGHLFLQDNVFNMTRFLPTEADWFYNKYVYPCLSLVVLLINICWIASIIRANILRSTKFTMYTIAFAEIFASIGYLPFVIYYIILGNHISFVPYTVCILIMLIVFVFTPVMHGLFLWTTLGISLQRLFVVSHPILASEPKYKHSVKIPFAFAFLICAFLCSAHISTSRYLLNIPSFVVPMKTNITETVTTALLPKFNIASNDAMTIGVGYLLQAIAVQVLPIMIMSFVCVSLRQKIERQRNIQAHLSEIPMRYGNSLDNMNRVSLIITAFILLSEIPNSIVAIFHCLNYIGIYDFKTTSFSMRTILAVCKVCGAISYCVNFCVCYMFSQTFRDFFKPALRCSRRKH